jgi:hypothetical protein
MMTVKSLSAHPAMNGLESLGWRSSKHSGTVE